MKPTNALILAVYYLIMPLLHVSTHTCVSSSGSSSVPTELHANRMQRLKGLCVVGCYVFTRQRDQTARCLYITDT
jgi:hypothetical protein